MKNAWKAPAAGAALVVLLTVTAYLPALRHKPDYAEAHFNTDLMLAAQSQTTEAVEHYRRTLDLANQNGDATLTNAVRSRIKLIGEAPRPL